VGQSRSGRSGEEEEKKFLSLPGIEPRTPFFSQTNVLKLQQNTAAFYQIPIPFVSAKTYDQKLQYL